MRSAWLSVARAVYQSDNEEREIRNFLERVKEDPVDVDWKTEGFYWYNNANNTPGECADFIFYKRND